MRDPSRHSGVHRSPRLHAGFCARCKSVSEPYWLASLLVYVMRAVVCVLRYSLSFFSPCVFCLDVTVSAAVAHIRQLLVRVRSSEWQAAGCQLQTGLLAWVCLEGGAGLLGRSYSRW